MEQEYLTQRRAVQMGQGGVGAVALAMDSMGAQHLGLGLGRVALASEGPVSNGTDETPQRPGLVPPAPGAPAWVQALTMLGQRLTLAAPEVGVAARLVVSAPCTGHIGAASVLCTIRPPEPGHPALRGGERVATVVSGKFVDGHVSTRASGRTMIEGVEFGNGLPPMHILEPDAFSDRRPAPVPEEGGRVAFRLRSDKPDDWAFQRLSLRPVVVLTNEPSAFLADLNDLACAPAWWSPLRRAALVEPRQGCEWWLRRPIVVLTPRAARQHPWLARLPLTAVVVIGFSAWADRARRLWPATPHMLVLGQRYGLEDFREWYDGTEFPTVSLPFGTDFHAAGLAARVFGEVVGADQGAEDDEWDF